MQAKTPEEVDTLFFEAMNRGDIDAAVLFHEPDARWFQDSGEIITGLPDIRAGLQKFLALKPRFTAEVTSLPSADGSVAITLATWSLVGTDPDGQPVSIAAKSRELVRRQPDGSWLFVIIAPGTD